MKCLGLHFGSHDASAALVIDGQLVAMMEQERFDHHKHSRAFPLEAARFCLDSGGVTLDQVDVVAYANDVAFTNAYKAAFVAAALPGAYRPHFPTQAEIERRLVESLGPCRRLWHVDHHLAHAASAFLVSPFDEAAILTIDGMGNWVSSTFAVGRGDEIETLLRVPHPHSLGLLYGAITQYLGFHAACDEGKTMGLAPYGRPTYLDRLRPMCRVTDQGGLELDLSWFNFHNQSLMDESGSPRRWYSDKLVESFGPPRQPESALDERAADMAASVQCLLEERCWEMLGHLHRRTGLSSLCLAGGVALNCSMNGRVRLNTAFKDVFVMPAANDAGLSLGAALLAARALGERGPRQVLTHAYWGSEHNEAEMGAALAGLPDSVSLTRPADLEEAVAGLLAEHAIVGWYQGRMEFGPRALGHRSILANPTRADAKDRVNAKVKFREAFRPFAPMVPDDEANEWFEHGAGQPFMLTVDTVREDRRDRIPAVTHVDGTARVQTVTPEQNPQIHRLLKAMGRRSGVPVLLNTSFNIRGDTIVRTPEDAVRCFLETGMAALALGPHLLIKSAWEA